MHRTARGPDEEPMSRPADSAPAPGAPDPTDPADQTGPAPDPPPAPGTDGDTGDPVSRLLRDRGYQGLMALCVLLGVPIALASFFFVSLQHWLQRQVWEDLPNAVGYDRAPWWWPLPALFLAGLILVPIVTRMPGRGGHVPVHGLGGKPIGPVELPSVVIAAVATLPLGVVLGPEAPLMALGSGLALLAMRPLKKAASPKGVALLATAGSTAAISTILGGPVVSAVLILEAAALAGPQMVALLLPCLIASATGALVFTGFGNWTGLSTGGLKLPQVPPDVNPDAGDFLWGIPIVLLIVVVVGGAHRLAQPTERWVQRNLGWRTLVCASAVGVPLAAYSLITDRSPDEAALSGQAMLGQLAASPHELSVGALIALVVCKALAWTVCLGALRGGPIFPAVLLGAATAMACSGLPGLHPTPALALGMAAGVAVVTGLPLTSSVLAVLLMGPDAFDQMPLIVVAAVVGFGANRLMPAPKQTPAAPAADAGTAGAGAAARP